MQSKQIPVVSSEEFRRLATSNPRVLHENPWIVEDYIKAWPGYEAWQRLEYLESRFGKLSAFAKAPNFITNRKSSLVSVETEFSRYLDYIRQPERARELFAERWMEGDYAQFVAQDLPLYCGTLRIVHKADDPVFAEVEPLVPAPLVPWNHALPYYYSLFNHFWLLVSLPGALTPLHIDNNGTIALIAQLKGRKRATLYSPDDLRHVYNPEVGYMDPEHPDEVDFPTWHQAVKWTGDLEVGQVLFVGTRWAHHVRTLDTSISVSFDFVDQSNLADYAVSTGWAEVFGKRIKSSPEAVRRKLGGSVPPADFDRLAPVELGRRSMAEVLRAALKANDGSELARIRRLYLTRLEQCLDGTDCTAEGPVPSVTQVRGSGLVPVR
ncbi:cupin-like domain-containing protein [Corallococcus macrosporus]|uniref:JmjC domain-containing protein n=1 Tax=Corallococcus macrosporus DSM 14697 TaxID=1189310 RepID=A0A250JWU6_9BACT|nr:cupin-like domain-containing protein [Corallococcus macrosporus]ATB48339.1 JmjC domain-containing protein [Corallococcus macrosporus DSM 14697]